MNSHFKRRSVWMTLVILSSSFLSGITYGDTAPAAIPRVSKAIGHPEPTGYVDVTVIGQQIAISGTPVRFKQADFKKLFDGTSVNKQIAWADGCQRPRLAVGDHSAQLMCSKYSGQRMAYKLQATDTRILKGRLQRIAPPRQYETKMG